MVWSQDAGLGGWRVDPVCRPAPPARRPSGPFPLGLSCDCPNHKIANGTWPGAPSLPTSLTTDYGVELSGEFLVERPPGGVAGEGPDLFPTASDYHLVCLQHNDAASMTIDGGSMYESGWTTETSAGGLGVVCREGAGGALGRASGRLGHGPRPANRLRPVRAPPLPRLQAVLHPSPADPRLALCGHQVRQLACHARRRFGAAPVCHRRRAGEGAGGSRK